MTGEMHESEVTEEAFPIHFALAKEFKGTVEPFDVYQGPYILLQDGTRLFIGSEDGVFGYVWNESTGESSTEFPCADGGEMDCLCAIDAARSVIPAHKTPGQLAYEADCTETPLYPHDGSKRLPWIKQCQIVRDSWERDPTPR